MRRSLLLVIGVILLSAAEARAIPRHAARYLVFELDANDAVTLVDSRRVSLASEESFGDSAVPWRHAVRGDAVEASLVGSDGTVIAKQIVMLDRHLRAEYATSADGTIAGHRVEIQRAPFVVRLPASDAAFVDLTVSRSGRTQRIAVSDIDRRARIRSDAADAGPAPVVATHGAAGDPANRVDLLVLGDGYTFEEVGKFYDDTARIIDEFLSIEPYASYRNYVNVQTIFVSSIQSGADHPYCEDAPDDPKRGSSVNTAFDATFCTSGFQRLLSVNNSKVYAFAAAVPDWDKIIVIVNDTTYGGSGGAISVASTHDRAVELVQHEYGHSFTGLADEYTSPYPAGGACTDALRPDGCEPNVTDQTGRALVKWAPWIAAGTPLPTPETITDAIGLFEGARYLSTGMYRPKYDCLMNRLSMEFCEICLQTYVKRLYGGWNGVPAKGIDPIDPGSERPSVARFSAIAGRTLSFGADLFGGSTRADLNVEWRVDGRLVEGVSDPSFTVTPAAAGVMTVELRVTDRTPLVHPAMRGASLTKTRTWTVDVLPGPPAKRRSIRP